MRKDLKATLVLLVLLVLPAQKAPRVQPVCRVLSVPLVRKA